MFVTDAYVQLARLVAAAGRYEAARGACEAGLTAVSRNADLNTLLGLACLALGELDLAESPYARAVGIGIDPAQPVRQLANGGGGARRLPERAAKQMTTVRSEMLGRHLFGGTSIGVLPYGQRT